MATVQSQTAPMIEAVCLFVRLYLQTFQAVEARVKLFFLSLMILKTEMLLRTFIA